MSGNLSRDNLFRKTKVWKASEFLDDPKIFRRMGNFENEFDRSLAKNNPLQEWWMCIRMWRDLYVSMGKPERVVGKVATGSRYSAFRDMCLDAVSHDDAVYRPNMHIKKDAGHWGAEYKAASAPDEVFDKLDRLNNALKEGTLPGLKKPLSKQKKGRETVEKVK